MIDEEEAERRAQELVKDYVTSAGCDDMNDVANVLAKLIAVAGMSIANASDRKTAIMRMSAATTMVQNAPLAEAVASGRRGFH